LLDKRFHDRVILGHLRGEIFLALQQGNDVVLQVNDFARDGAGRTRPEGTAHEDAGKERQQ